MRSKIISKMAAKDAREEMVERIDESDSEEEEEEGEEQKVKLVLPRGMSKYEKQQLRMKEIDRAARKIKACDGKDMELLKQWVKDVSYAVINNEHRVALAIEAARGRLAKEIGKCDAKSWEELKNYVMDTFIAHDYRKLQRRALTGIRQDQKESLRTFNFRFLDMVEEAYEGSLTESEEEQAINAYLAALYIERYVEKILEEGETPVSLAEAMKRAQTFDRIAELKKASGRAERSVKVAALRDGVAEETSDVAKLQAEVAALTATVHKLQAAPVEGIPAMPQPLNTENPSFVIQPPSTTQQLQQRTGHVQDSRIIVCFKCGKPGHVIRECRWQTAPKPSRNFDADGRPICFTCRQSGHIARDCRSNPRQPASARYATRNTSKN